MRMRSREDRRTNGLNLHTSDFWFLKKIFLPGQPSSVRNGLIKRAMVTYIHVLAKHETRENT